MPLRLPLGRPGLPTEGRSCVLERRHPTGPDLEPHPQRCQDRKCKKILELIRRLSLNPRPRRLSLGPRRSRARCRREHPRKPAHRPGRSFGRRSAFRSHLKPPGTNRQRRTFLSTRDDLNLKHKQSSLCQTKKLN